MIEPISIIDNKEQVRLKLELDRLTKEFLDSLENSLILWRNVIKKE